MRVGNLDSRWQLKWMGEFGWSLGLGILGSIATEDLRVVVAVVEDLLYF